MFFSTFLKYNFIIIINKANIKYLDSALYTILQNIFPSEIIFKILYI